MLSYRIILRRDIRFRISHGAFCVQMIFRIIKLTLERGFERLELLVNFPYLALRIP